MIYRRNPEQQTNSPTISTIAIDDTDHDVGGTKDYQVNIRHCRDWKPYAGERCGFMANYSFRLAPHASGGNGEFYPIVDGDEQAAYDKAIADGFKLAEARQNELDESMAATRARERVRDAIETHYPNESDMTLSLMRRTTGDLLPDESMSDLDLQDLIGQVYDAVIFTTGDYPEGHGFGSSDFNIVKERVQRNIDAWHKWKAEQTA